MGTVELRNDHGPQQRAALSAILLRVNLPTASEAREPDVYRDWGNRSLDRRSMGMQPFRVLTTLNDSSVVA